MICALALMSYLMLHTQNSVLGIGDLLFFLSAVCWGIFTVLLKEWKLSAWHAMASVAIWSAIIYLPIYLIFIPKHFQEVEPIHLLVQGLFHGVLVVIVATLTYIAAIERLGAFKTGSITTLAPFIAAVVAVPLLNEPLSMAILCGLIGMGVGALQPWRWFRQDTLSKQLKKQNQ
jgi:drug/metabolite transporter (DMT)-like permease